MGITFSDDISSVADTDSGETLTGTVVVATTTTTNEKKKINTYNPLMTPLS